MRKKGIVVAVSFVAIVLVVLGLRTRQPAERASSAVVVSPSAGALARAAAPKLLASPKLPTVETEFPEPVIERITVEKTEVCRGEQNFATVEIRTADAADAHVFVMLADGSAGGRRLPFRLEAPMAAAEMPRVRVHGRHGALVMGQLPPVTVKDCDAPPRLELATRFAETSSERFVLSATIGAAQGAPAPDEALTYDWDFGDGTSLRTTTGEVEHGYENRLQDVRMSSFLVHATATTASGQRFEGWRTIDLVNLGFGSLARRDQVLLFADRDLVGDVVGLRHGHAQPVRIERVRVKELAEVGEAAARELDASVLGFSEIPAGETRRSGDLSAVVPPRAGVARVFEIIGHSADGKSATGSFTLPAPPPA